MLLKTRGIVFRSVKYSETSVIADIYTEEKGLQTFIMGGVRKAKSKTSPGLLQVGALVELVAYFRDDKPMHRISELRPAYVFSSLPFDIKKGAVSLFIAEVCQKTIRTGEENRRLFDFLFHAFEWLDTTPHSIANYHLAFLIELTGFLGFLPGGDWTSATPFFDMREGVFQESPPPYPDYLEQEQSESVGQLLGTDLSTVHELNFTRAQRKTLLRNLLEYYHLHIEYLPAIHAHDILEMVMGE